MKSVITKLEAVETTLGVERFELSVRGRVAQNTIVEVRTDINTGNQHVFIQTPLAGGISPSTMDAVARRLLAGARKYAGNNITALSVVRTGRYAVPRS